MEDNQFMENNKLVEYNDSKYDEEKVGFVGPALRFALMFTLGHMGSTLRSAFMSTLGFVG